MTLALLLVTLAPAQDMQSNDFVPKPVAGHSVMELRVGAGTTDPTHPNLCAELAPTPWLSVEGCGTGSGFLHRSDAPDMAHFRARAISPTLRRGRAELDGRLGLGFAEIQRAADEPGFQFGAAQTPDPVEAAGPEASLSAQGRLWFDERFYGVADINVGAAHIVAAPDVLGRGGPLVPFASATVGFGF